jgi:hypothetical protein
MMMEQEQTHEIGQQGKEADYSHRLTGWNV